jgi:hypothetical protein
MDGQSVKLNLIEGEEIDSLVQFQGTLFVHTNLNRVFKSVDTPVEHIDFVEVKP